MAIAVKFYTFSKKPNSTKQPESSGHSFNCILLEPSSVISPAISLNVGKSENPSEYNYAYISEFKRYYFVTDWNYSSGLWIASLTVDVMASWKINIGTATKYVLRSSNKSNGDIFDSQYPTTANIRYNIENAGSAWECDNYQSGVYVLGIIGAIGGEAAAGSVKYWAFTYQQLQNFIKILLGTTDWFDGEGNAIEEIGNALAKVLFNPLEYIVSCRWYPFNVERLSVTAQTVVAYGWWALVTDCYTINDCVTTGRASLFETFTVPKHPQAAERGAYLNQSPFTRHMIQFAPWGSFELDGAYALGDVALATTVDITTGTAKLDMLVGPAGNITNIPPRIAKVGVDIPLTQLVGITPQDLAKSLAGIATSVVVGDAVGALGGAIDAVTNFANPTMTQTGSQSGSFIGLGDDVVLRSIFYMVTDDDNDNKGRPLCSTIQLSEIPGFIQCADGYIELPAMTQERNEISSYLKEGFFYE